jgi:hypothetical protein
MNCNTCRYELSQCLDGRLPSGRRTVVLQHAEACADCGTFWTELQSAQRLSLQLQPVRVSEGFRDQLWERIRAGEGSPEAIFHEPIPLLTKVRYALTGAAAAAAVLLGALLLRQEPTGGGTGSHDPGSHDPGSHDPGSRTSGASLAGTASGGPTTSQGGGLQPRHAQHAALGHADPQPFDDTPLISSAQRLTFDLVAVETAKQLEQRYAAATTALRRLDELTGREEVAVRQVFENTDEFQAFGELLLDLRDRQRLAFTDNDVDVDLRFAVNMLARSRKEQRTLETARTMVAPALRSGRLAGLSRTIMLAPSLDRREEMEALLHLSTRRPEVFQELFYVFGSQDDVLLELGPMRHGAALFLDDCGPSWVAPRSEVEAREGRIRLFRGRQGVQIHLESK